MNKKFASMLAVIILATTIIIPFLTIVAGQGISLAPQPSLTPSPGTVDQGQTSNLTSSAVTTGTPPYTYQWYSKVDAGSYSSISGATSSSYTFVTSSSTATGNWSFILQITDSNGAAVNSTIASVTVNSALAVPTESALAMPGVVYSGGTASLTTLYATTTRGTPPYTFQWFNRAPGSSQSLISGATSASYTFVTSGSTALGQWNFWVQVTDGAGASVDSTVVSVTVKSAVESTPTAASAYSALPAHTATPAPTSVLPSRSPSPAQLPTTTIAGIIVLVVVAVAALVLLTKRQK